MTVFASNPEAAIILVCVFLEPEEPELPEPEEPMLPEDEPPVPAAPPEEDPAAPELPPELSPEEDCWKEP